MEFPKGHKDFSKIERGYLRNMDSPLIFYYKVYINFIQLLNIGYLGTKKTLKA